MDYLSQALNLDAPDTTLDYAYGGATTDDNFVKVCLMRNQIRSIIILATIIREVWLRVYKLVRHRFYTSAR